MIGLFELERELKSLENTEKKKVLRRFFKTGRGKYGEGDIFLGITVPVQRAVCKKYDLSLQEIEKLLLSEIHEFRLCGLLLLVRKFEMAESGNERGQIVQFYTSNAKRINNWDLVDLSAPKILGAYLLGKKDREILYKLAKSKNLWERRISIVSTYALIRKGEFLDTLRLAQILIGDRHDLMHKAVGWMLREVGKKDEGELVNFLDKWAGSMPRTMLRYSIERFGAEMREYYLGK